MRRSDGRQTYDELLAVIRRVRRRWRVRVLLKGLALTGAVALVAVLGAGAAMEALDPAPGLALALRITAALVVLGAVAVLLVRPLLRRVADEAVALYLEEHEPSLEAAVLSALEARPGESAAGLATSDALLRRTLEDAIRRCHAIEDGRWIERAALVRVSAALGAVALVGALLGFLGPESARRGAARLFSPPRAAEAAGVAAIDVTPGNATIARGADAAISARLRGVDSELVELVVRSPGDSAFDRLPMAPTATGAFGYHLFDLEEETEYFVEADGVRSPLFTLTVGELPYVDRLDLELVFPAYTGLPSTVQEDGGDVTALRGTTVRVRVTPTVPVTGGGIVVDDAAPLPLSLAADSSGALTGEFTVRSDGFYHIVLEDAAGAAVEASPRWVIDALSDGEPIVAFEEPGRDERATPIDELFVEARAEDDYGIASLTLHYTVNGGEEETVALYGGRGGLREVTAGHTFYLEELPLEPGDLVAYWATAADNDGVAGGKRATSDIYFVQIRPFSREFRAAEQRAPPQGGPPQQGADGDLTRRQRQVVAGTFNVVRDSASLPAEELRESVNTLALAQERLRDDARSLARQMVARQVTADSAFREIAELLPRAADEMERALEELRAPAPTDALAPEQRALRLLQRAEAVFREVQVSLGQNPAGGQPGGAPTAEDLADLFELEMDRLRDPYETVNRGGAAGDSTTAELDEAAERLDELARRQQREEERRRAQAQQGRGTAGGGAQRALAEQAEEEARRLERLSREQRRPELEEAARSLRDAAASMRRSAAGAPEGERARERLEDARRLLERSGTEQLRRRAADAAERAERLAGEQERIRRESERLLDTPMGAGRDERAGALEEQKDRQREEVEALEGELRRLAGETAGEQPEASRRLREAAGTISESQLEEKIDFSRQLARGGAPDDYVRRLEEQIQQDLEAVRDRLEGVEDAIRHPEREDDEAGRALERARELARGLESMRQRGRELQESAGGNPRGARGGLDPDAVRQARGEAARRLQEARALGEEMRRQGLDAGAADELVRGIEALTGSGAYGDVEELARLQAALADRAKRLELVLRVRLAGEEGLRLFQAGGGVVPEGYRDLVDAYYRSLSRENRSP